MSAMGNGCFDWPPDLTNLGYRPRSSIELDAGFGRDPTDCAKAALSVAKI